jgi:hypothetical protein
MRTRRTRIHRESRHVQMVEGQLLLNRERVCVLIDDGDHRVTFVNGVDPTLLARACLAAGVRWARQRQRRDGDA